MYSTYLYLYTPSDMMHYLTQGGPGLGKAPGIWCYIIIS